MRKMKLLYVGCLLLAVSSTGCSVTRLIINYVPTRVAREFLGQQTNVHPIVPITTDLRRYHVLAIKNLDNMMLDEIPDRMYNYLNHRIMMEISRRRLFSRVVRIEDEAELETGEVAPPTLILEGSVDNYHAGARGLRLAEVGLNHAVVTIRVRLRDRQTDEIVGSVSITVYERAARKTVTSAINKAAKEAAEFIKRGKDGSRKRSK